MNDPEKMNYTLPLPPVKSGRYIMVSLPFGKEVREAMGRLAAENLAAVLEGREPPCPVN